MHHQSPKHWTMRQLAQPSGAQTLPSVERSVPEKEINYQSAKHASEVQIVQVTELNRNRTANCSEYQKRLTNEPARNQLNCQSHYFNRSMQGENPYGGSLVPRSDYGKPQKNGNAFHSNNGLRVVSMLSQSNLNGGTCGMGTAQQSS